MRVASPFGSLRTTTARPIILSVGLFLGVASSLTTLVAEPFTKAELTRKTNVVDLTENDKSRPAVVGDTVSGSTGVKTGTDSRAELRFTDDTITRLGANTFFTFKPGGREMDLGNGTMLFSAPKGQGGGQVQAGAVTAAVTGTTFLLSRNPDGSIRLVVLEGTVVLALRGQPNSRQTYQAGESVTVPAGSLRLPRGVTINLKRVIDTSLLLEAGGFGALPDQPLVLWVANHQKNQDSTSSTDGTGPGNSPTGANESVFNGPVQSQE